MLKYINRLPNPYREGVNVDIMNKAYDKPLQEYIFDVFKSMEILPNIKVLGYEWVPDEDKYDVNDHIIRRNTNKNRNIKNIAETRCGVMYIDFEISGLNKNGNIEVVYLKKPLILPIQDKNGYYLIKGKKCYLIYQMVDKMLYPSFGAVTIKSLMPVCTKNNKMDFVDTKGDSWTVPVYNIQIFKNAINCLLIYSNLTVSKSLNFMEVDRFIHVEPNTKNLETNDHIIRFECGKKSDIIVAVKRDIFEKEVYVKSIVGCLINMFETNKTQYEDIDNWEYWMTIVGGKNTIRRGIYQHIFFNRLLDDVTRKELKINDYDKQNIYYLLRWIIQNYHSLWTKDNLSMDHKRLRCNECASALLTMEVSKRINRLVSLGDKATIKEYRKALRFPEDIFLTRLYSSGLLRYVENNSDTDFSNKWKLTKKGPQSLGGNDARRIPIRQRSLHPSMLGRIDLADGSSSDPGQSMALSPWCDMESMYFDDSLYENEMHFKLSKYLDENPLSDEDEELRITCDNEKEYNEALDALFRYGDGKLKMYGVSVNPLEIIVEKDPRDNYREFDESMLMEDEYETNN